MSYFGKRHTIGVVSRKINCVKNLKMNKKLFSCTIKSCYLRYHNPSSKQFLIPITLVSPLLKTNCNDDMLISSNSTSS